MRMGTVKLSCLLTLVLCIVLTWCSLETLGQPPVVQEPQDPRPSEDTSAFTDPKVRDAEETYRHRQEQLRLAVCPNEVGQIMVLMYHRIGDSESDWCRSRENFRKDLERLRENGYYPINLDEFLLNDIDVPLGKTPVLITFDDAHISQFRAETEGGKIVVDPDCALGIMEEFVRRHPDFPIKANFFLSARPFGQSTIWREKLRYLLEHGHSLGNHTYSHILLNRHSAAEITEELGKLAKEVAEATGGYQFKGLALPCGIAAKDPKAMIAGEYQGFAYQNLGIFAVGAGPTWSPVHQKFNPQYIPRIQACDSELDKWFSYFDKHPEKRYISDGDPDTITIPELLKDQLADDRLGDKRVIYYCRSDNTP